MPCACAWLWPRRDCRIGGTVGYELFDEANPLTTSDFLGNVNLRRAVEGELARTIGTLRGVRSARVHIVEPKRSLFGREEIEAQRVDRRCSLRGAAALDKRQIAGIRHLVAAAVPGLRAEGVTVLDDAGNLLAEPSDPGDGLGSIDDAEEHRAALENRLRAKIVQLLERTVGPGKADAAVSARPRLRRGGDDGRAVRSGKPGRAQHPDDRGGQRPQGEPGRGRGERGEQPADRARADGRRRRRAASAPTGPRRRSTTRSRAPSATRAKRGASLRKLSIAVQVDGVYREQADGTSAYEPRSAEELSQLAALVRSAAGVDESRGDVVEIVSRPFVSPEAPPPPEQSWRRRSSRKATAGSSSWPCSAS